MQTPVIVAFILVFSAQPVAALTDEEIFRELRFNLINPGARARGIGGAFISLADDATAAQANPAGLSFLRRAEYFGELRLVDNTTETTRASETLPTIGVDTTLVSGTDIDDTLGLSFFSAVIPLGGWTLGFSLQELLDIDNRTLSSFSAISQGSPGFAEIEGNGSIRVTVRNANVSFGYRVTDHLGLGGTLTYSRIETTAEVVNVAVDTQPLFSDETLLLPTVDLRTSIDDTDDDLAFSLGLIYKRSEGWGVGAVYRKAPRFRMTEKIDPLQDADGDGNFEGVDLFGTRDRLGTAFTNDLHLPDSFGVGGNYLLLDQRLTLALDAEWIRYSNLVDGYIPGVNVLTLEDAVFDVDDGVDTHFGAEYVLFNRNNRLPPLALRAGLFLESDTTITADSTGSAGLTLSSPEVFRGRDSQLHGTLGVGFNFKHWKLDTAIDIAETDNEFLVSVIYRK